jgi:serine/threonine-protein kinase HipA
MVNIITVYLAQSSGRVKVGRLYANNRKIYFEYDQAFIKTELQISPFKIPTQSGVLTCDDTIFEGLFGVFNDSIPDGWGRLLLDRNLAKSGINPNNLTPLDRLSYVGTRGMGALMYEPEINDGHSTYYKNLDKIASDCLQFQQTDEGAFIEDLLNMNGSSAGARPKVLLSFVDSLKKEYSDWIVKFRSQTDPLDIGPIEYAYHLMAKDCKLNVPEAKLFPSKNKYGYFGVKRFDRIDSQIYHMHSIAGLLHSDHRAPSLDYETVMKCTAILTKDIRECERQFRQAVFNLLSHNRDDHSKNFSFLMDDKGIWKVSPAYDLTFSSGPSGEHCTMFCNEGKNPKLPHLLKLAKTSNIKEHKALEIIEEVKSVVTNWSNYAKIVGVSPKSSRTIETSINLLIRSLST